MATGIVKFFKTDKGFGFIKDKETGKEVFVHATGLLDEIKQNDEVEFDVEEGKKGPQAVSVRLAVNA